MQQVDLKELTCKMDELKDAKARLEFDLKQVEKEIEKVELELVNILDKTGVERMDYGTYTFGWEIKKRKAFSQKAFAQVYPDLLEKFKLEIESKQFVFKVNR